MGLLCRNEDIARIHQREITKTLQLYNDSGPDNKWFRADTIPFFCYEMVFETADIRRRRLNGQQCNVWCQTATIDNLRRCCVQETIVRGVARGHPLFLSPGSPTDRRLCVKQVRCCGSWHGTCTNIG